MRPLLDRLRAGEIIVADGALGTQLIERGLRPGEPPEAFNLSRAPVLEEIARSYAEAGAQLVSTNTFGGTLLRLRDYGLEGQADEINRAAVEAARRGAGDRAYVSGSIGPSGKLLKPYGDLDPEELADGYARQARTLAEAGVDLFCIETMTDLEEARLAVAAARAAAPGAPVIATMTFEPTRRGFFTMMGVSVEKAARGLAEAGADVVGSNCGNGVEAMTAIAREFRACTTMPLAIQANAGLPESRAGALIYPETPEMFAATVPLLLAAGVRIIGGCCGTTPAHIVAILDAVRAAQPAEA